MLVCIYAPSRAELFIKITVLHLLVWASERAETREKETETETERQRVGGFGKCERERDRGRETARNNKQKTR